MNYVIFTFTIPQIHTSTRFICSLRFTIISRPSTACGKWPAQQEVANVFLFESLLNLDNNMSPDWHTVGLKGAPDRCQRRSVRYVYMSTLFVHSIEHT